MIKRQLVLVAIDHVIDIERTMNVAFRMARERRADVHVIRAVPHRAAFRRAVFDKAVRHQAVRLDDHFRRWAFEPHDGRRAVVEGRVTSFLRSNGRGGVRVQRVTLRGEPEQVIPAYAQLHEATLLVTEHNYGSSHFWRNGRVVDEVARQSPMPVLVLPKRQSRGVEEPALRRILAPVDFSIASAVAIRTAVDLSRRHGARVTLLHTMTNVPQRMVYSGSEALEVVRRLPARAEAVAGRLRRKAAFFGANDVETEVVTGVADSAILETATRREADLIVMGIANSSWLDRALFGSTLRRVLRRATVPVLVLPVVAGAQAWPDEPAGEQIGTREWTDTAVERVAG